MEPLSHHAMRELLIVSDHSKTRSILDLFDHTHTSIGREQLRAMISTPKTSIAEIQAFQEVIRFISNDLDNLKITIPRSYISATETYLQSSISYTMSQDVVMHWFETMVFSFRHPAEFSRTQSGIFASYMFIEAVKNLSKQFSIADLPQGLKDDFQVFEDFLEKASVQHLLKKPPHKLSNSKVFYYDYFIRVSKKKLFRKVLDTYYKLDALIAIAKTTALYGFTFPFFDKKEAIFKVSGLYHPLLQNPIANDLETGTNLCLITGANTSGKTTFLKSCGLVIYLAHLGWPVPAKALTLSFVNRLYTSIQLSDDLGLGYSHFYNEVMRVKEVIVALDQGHQCFVIIDELFRGTNAEDAYACSNIVLTGLQQYSNSSFLISTHLLDLVRTFENNQSLTLKCFKTIVTGTSFENNFQISDGIATEKIGTLILKNTGVVALLGS